MSDVPGCAGGDRSRQQRREIRFGRVPLLPPDADNAGLLVRHELEREMGRRLVLANRRTNAHEPRATLQMEELALEHTSSDDVGSGRQTWGR